MNAINLGIGWYERPEGYRGNEFRWLIRSIGMGSGERLSRFVTQLAGKALNFYFWTTIIIYIEHEAQPALGESEG
jgi:hypothetical protein